MYRHQILEYQYMCSSKVRYEFNLLIFQNYQNLVMTKMHSLTNISRNQKSLMIKPVLQNIIEHMDVKFQVFLWKIEKGIALAANKTFGITITITNLVNAVFFNSRTMLLNLKLCR